MSTLTNTLATGPLSGEAIVDLDVVVHLDHTFIGDLTINLTSPSGTVVTLQNVLCAGNDNLEIIYDDEAASAVVCGTPTVGRFRTSGTAADPLSDFDTELFEGTWTLTVIDGVGGDVGTLLQWCLVPTLLIPDCPSPSAFTVLNTGATSVTLDWTSGAGNTGYTIEYGPAGFIPGTGTTTSGTPPGPVSIGGLSQATAYDFYLTETCPAGSSFTLGP